MNVNKGLPAKHGVIERGSEQPTDTCTQNLSRRDFLKTAGGASALTAAATVGLGGMLGAVERAEGQEIGASGLDNQRRATAFRIRSEAARAHLQEKTGAQLDNGDEERYADKRASFFKTLPHDNLGEVDPDAYARYLAALRSGEFDDLDDITLLSPLAERKLANPLGAYAFDMTGVDSHATRMAPAPALASQEAAAEIGEIYWLALTRDVPYQEWGSDSTIDAALDDLNNAFFPPVGPKEDGFVTVNTLFRGETPGDLIGPYLSQFLWLDVPYGPSTIEQRYAVPVSGIDFMIDYVDWLAIQRGAAPEDSISFEAPPRYLYNNRAFAEYVHRDVAFQAHFNAALIMTGFGSDALDRNNPYLYSATQTGFVTFGGPHIFDLVTKAARVGLEGAWFHKWLVHRRLRPEVFGARIENQLNGAKDYGVHPDILGSEAVARVFAANGNRLLPQAYPEGSPTHPSYPAGHSVLAGACATVLKAVFDEDYVIPDPVQASVDGLTLEPWTGEELTLGNEINKLASNISVGRCAAGVHYRSDNRGLAVGEAQAIGILQDYSLTYNEDFDGFTLTTFDGGRIRIVDGLVLSA